MKSASNCAQRYGNDTKLSPFLVLHRLLFSDVNLLLDLLQINMCDSSIFTIEDLSQFLESGTTGLNVEEVNKDKFDEDPNLEESNHMLASRLHESRGAWSTYGVDERQIPVVRKVLPRNRVGVTG